MTRRVRSAHLQPSPYSAYFWHTKIQNIFLCNKEYVVLRTNIHPKSGRHHQKVDVPSLATNYTVV